MGDNINSIGSPKPKKSVHDFEFGEVIGEGSYGEVKIVVEKESGNVFAAKILVKKHIVKEKKHKYVSTEKAILDILRHPNIVQLYCTFQDRENLYFIIELCHAGDLLSHLNKVGAFDEASARFYAAEVLSSIVYMHKKCVAHRDIKPENVLLVPSMHAKLSDFGCAKQFGDVRERSNSFCGTPEYVCPELLTDNKSAGVEADMWSFGVLLFQMLTGKLPFRGITEYHTLRAVAESEYHTPQWLSVNATDLIKKLLIRDPAERLTAEGATKHAFFADVDWENLHTHIPPPITRSPFYVPQLSPIISHHSSTASSPGSTPESPVLIEDSFDRDLSSSSSISSSVSPLSSPHITASPIAGQRTGSHPTNSSAPPPKFHATIVFPESLTRVTSDYTASKWSFITGDEVALSTCSMQKRNKLLTRKRVLIITNKRFIIANPRKSTVKCSMEWEDENFSVSAKEKLFVLSTPSRTFTLVVSGGNAQKWVDLIGYHQHKHNKCKKDPKY